jgi:hypothetical protein
VREGRIRTAVEGCVVVEKAHARGGHDGEHREAHENDSGAVAGIAAEQEVRKQLDAHLTSGATRPADRPSPHRTARCETGSEFKTAPGLCKRVTRDHPGASSNTARALEARTYPR